MPVPDPARPIDRPGTPAHAVPLDARRATRDAEGMFALEGFATSEGLAAALAEIRAELAAEAFTHERERDIHSQREVPGLPFDHLALASAASACARTTTPTARASRASRTARTRESARGA